MRSKRGLKCFLLCALNAAELDKYSAAKAVRDCQ